MVEEINKQGRKIYQCKICKLLYNEKKWAQMCENWCSENNTCNINITKHRIKEEKNEDNN